MGAVRMSRSARRSPRLVVVWHGRQVPFRYVPATVTRQTFLSRLPPAVRLKLKIPSPNLHFPHENHSKILLFLFSSPPPYVDLSLSSSRPLRRPVWCLSPLFISCAVQSQASTLTHLAVLLSTPPYPVNIIALPPTPAISTPRSSIGRRYLAAKYPHSPTFSTGNIARAPELLRVFRDAM
jgi:hypothetical protein